MTKKILIEKTREELTNLVLEKEGYKNISKNEIKILLSSKGLKLEIEE